MLFSGLNCISSILLYNPFRRRTVNPTLFEDGTRGSRLMRGLIYRFALLPPMIMLFASALVYSRTHPPPQPAYGLDPLAQGVFYEPVNILTEDNVRLDAWLAPALDAQQVLSDGDETLHQRWPAVILVHGFGMSRQQMLPLVAPLHLKRWVVLALAMRGSGGGSGNVGQTFGLNESLDVKAAIDLLRRRSYVDGTKIAIVGVGTGANAALLAAEHDPALAALVLDSPVQSGELAMMEHIVSGPEALKYLSPVCKIAFTIGYGADLEDIDMSQYGHVLTARPSLLMRWPQDAEEDLPQERVEQITDFLSHALDKVELQADAK
jgi:pimeloyl-ACP methyl ester carboxylesterase